MRGVRGVDVRSEGELGAGRELRQPMWRVFFCVLRACDNKLVIAKCRETPRSVARRHRCHGHEVGRGSGGQHPARWLVGRTGVSSLCGHFHRTDTHSIRTALGEYVHGFTIGALCQLSPDYLPRNQWNHGAAFVQVNADGSYLVENKILHP